MKTLEDVCNYFELWSRYHPEYDKDEQREVFVQLLESLPQQELHKVERLMNTMKTGKLVELWKTRFPKVSSNNSQVNFEYPV